MCRVFGLNLEKCEFCPCGGTLYLLKVGEGRKMAKDFFFPSWSNESKSKAIFILNSGSKFLFKPFLIETVSYKSSKQLPEHRRSGAQPGFQPQMFLHYSNGPAQIFTA